MTARTARIISGVLLVASVAMLAASLPIQLAAKAGTEPGQIVVVGDPTAPRMQEVRAELEDRVAAGADLLPVFNPAAAVAFVAFSVLWVGTGGLIVGRQQRNVAGWIFIAVGMTGPVLLLCGTLMNYGVRANPGSVPGIGVAAVVGEFALIPVTLLPLLFLWYPDGRPPSPRWRWASRTLFAGVGIALIGLVLKPGPLNNWVDAGIVYENPLGIRSFTMAGAVIAAGTIPALLAALSTAVAVVLRFRRSRGEERQQMRWLAFVAGVGGLFLVLMFLGALVAELLSIGKEGEEPRVFDILFGLAAIMFAFGVPVGYLIAIFRYRLYDIDVVIKKTVVFGLLAAFLAAVYVAVVAGIGALVGSRSNAVLSFAAAALLALLFQPARDRARRLADRLVYGKRATPYEVLAEFSERMGETYGSEDVLVRMARILAEGTGASSARVWLRIGPELRVEAAWPEASGGDATLAVRGDELPAFPPGEDAFEVRHQGDLLGALTVTMPASDPMNPAKAKLVSDLAAQAGLVLRNVRLIEELRESRRRIVTAQDARAKALERNIHDGAQQQLVALSVQLGLLQRLVDQDAARAKEVAEALQQNTNDALENLRDLARGIYPPLLADRGLVAALESQARKSPVAVAVEAEAVGRYPPDVEATVYFSVLEALANVAKYARATRATVGLSGDDGMLAFTVRDDGAGFDPSSTGYGTGLQGIADRVAALGGSLAVDSAPGRGTTVTGRLPVQGGPAREDASLHAEPIP